jgi:hypothetical protein
MICPFLADLKKANAVLNLVILIILDVKYTNMRDILLDLMPIFLFNDKVRFELILSLHNLTKRSAATDVAATQAAISLALTIPNHTKYRRIWRPIGSGYSEKQSLLMQYLKQMG